MLTRNRHLQPVTTSVSLETRIAILNCDHLTLDGFPAAISSHLNVECCVYQLPRAGNTPKSVTVSWEIAEGVWQDGAEFKSWMQQEKGE